MSELVVVAFDNETGAAEMRDALVELQKQGLVTLDDAAVVVRRPDGKAKVKQAVNLVGSGALPAGPEALEPELRESLPPDKLDMNLQAFRRGVLEVTAGSEPT